MRTAGSKDVPQVPLGPWWAQGSGTIVFLNASVLEDDRGVDRQQIRELLELSPTERLIRWSPKDEHALPYLESLRDEIASQREDQRP